MLRTYPAAWVLVTLPFLSSILLRSVPPLWRLATTRNRWTRCVGTVGLVCLLAGLLGILPPPCALPLAILGGAVSGYAVYSLPRPDSGGNDDDWRRPDTPPDAPPPPPSETGPIDWERFDRLRRQWERRPVTRA